uniref:Uncharacterized protein n=1 Tax=Anguilla anguilla TaxID=7936 RepID=A0A0E9SHD0_ANGAN
MSYFTKKSIAVGQCAAITVLSKS